MGHRAVDDVGAVHPRLQGAHAAGELGDHARGQLVAANHGLGLAKRHLGDERRRVGVVLVQAVHIGEEDDLVGADGRGDVPGGDVGVHVVAAAILADGDGGDDGNVVVGHQVLDEGRVDAGDLPHAAKSRVGLLGHDDAGIGARYAHTHVAVGVHGLHELLVHLAGEHHAHKPHGLIGGDALAVDELHGNVELVEHAIDGLAAAVHEHRVDADDLQQHDVGHNFGGKLRVLHGRAAVLDDDSLARDLLDPGHGLVENFAGSAGRTVGTNIACVLHER